MFRKLTIALVAVTAIGIAAFPTGASAHGHRGWHRHHGWSGHHGWYHHHGWTGHHGWYGHRGWHIPALHGWYWL